MPTSPTSSPRPASSTCAAGWTRRSCQPSRPKSPRRLYDGVVSEPPPAGSVVVVVVGDVVVVLLLLVVVLEEVVVVG
jgi:hypothetical protein